VNLARIIEPHPAGAVAFRYEGSSVTYGQLRHRAAAVQRSLAARGIEPGERVALVFPAEPGFAVGYLGVLRAGLVAVPLNPQSPLAEIGRELVAIRVSLVLMGQAQADQLRSAIEGLGYDVATLAELGAAVDDEGAPSQADAAAEPAPPLVDRDPDDPAALLFTSGTAGFPKAAVLTHGSLLANIEQMELRVGLAVTADDVGILVVPPFHILGLNAVLGVQLFAGGELLLVERFEPASFLRAVAEARVTILAGVPQLFAALADLDARGDELSSVRLACSGAAPLPIEVAERFEQRFGIRIHQGYGLTEASPAVTFPDLDAAWAPLSVGIPLPGVEVRIVDTDGDDVEPGDPGEILVRGPNVFAGYFEDPRATAAALDRSGWLHTGDIAVMADDSSLTIVDRSKDLVIVSGFNVFPAEVEAALASHPAVAEAAVVGVPDVEHGEAVRAYVVPVASAWPESAERPEGVSEQDLVQHCMRCLARYKCPSVVTFVRELPRGLQGKVLRREIA